MACAFSVREVARGTRAPLDLVVAVGREELKNGKYAPLLAAATPPRTLTQLVFEMFDRVGLATADFLREAFAGPVLSSMRTGLLRYVSVAIWRSVVKGVQEGYDNCFDLKGAPGSEEAGVREMDVSLARVSE